MDGEILPFDLSVLNDPQYTAVYSSDIFDFLKIQEVSLEKTNVDTIHSRRDLHDTETTAWHQWENESHSGGLAGRCAP